jgi:predicted DsbA family dithiol-disulfide isomerase
MRVDIWSDVVCPWCYVGKRRFESALARFPHADGVEVVWRSFELDPFAPPSAAEPGDHAEHLARKYGTPLERAKEMTAGVTAVAAAEGLDFRFDRYRRGNTFDAHRLLHLGLERGVQDELKERLDHATFTEGLPVSDHGELTRVAVEAGLEEPEVEAVLASGRYSQEVRADEDRARAYGISAVPFFVIDGKYGVAGAQPAEYLLEALETAWRERSPITSLGPSDSAASCEDDSCAL